MAPLKNQTEFENEILFAVKRAKASPKRQALVSLGGGSAIVAQVGVTGLISVYTNRNDYMTFIGHYFSEDLATTPGISLAEPKINPTTYQDLLEIYKLFWHLDKNQVKYLQTKHSRLNPLTPKAIKRLLAQTPSGNLNARVPATSKTPDADFDKEIYELERQKIALEKRELELKMDWLRKQREKK